MDVKEMKYVMFDDWVMGLIVVEGGGFLREEVISTMIKHHRSELTHDRARL
jgi:hypothetical protein